MSEPFSVDFSYLKIDQNVVNKLNLPKLIAQELETTNTRIKKAAGNGQDVEGGALKEYSASYKLAIEKKQIPGKGSTKTNLTVTQTLLRSMQVTMISPTEGNITFSGTHPPTKRKAKAPRKDGKPSKPAKPQKTISNATLAGYLYGMGYVGWVGFGTQDILRITNRVADTIDKVTKTELVTIGTPTHVNVPLK